MRKWAAIVGTGLVLAGASAARAGVSVDVRIGPACPPPPPPVIYTPTPDQVWVPAVTQTVVQNTWHEPVTQDQVTHTWVPDQYALQNVVVPGPNGLPMNTQQNVLVAPGHWQDVHTPVVVRAGYWGPEAQTVVVAPGYWQTVQRPVFVRGYCPPGPPPVVVYHEDRWHGGGYYDHRYGYYR